MFILSSEKSKTFFKCLRQLCGLEEQRCLRCAEPCPIEKIERPFATCALPLCNSCRKLLPPLATLSSQLCQRCSLPMNAPIYADDPLSFSGKKEIICPYCRYNPPPWSQIYCYGAYQGHLRELLLKAKFGGNLSANRLAGLLLSEATIIQSQAAVSDSAKPWDMVTAVPLHPERLKKRGLNQGLEIARVLANSLRLPLRPRLLQRILPTTPQAGLSQRERRRNLRGAIVCKDIPQQWLTKSDGLTVLLVDDILTTGTTLSRCTNALLKAGVARVEVAVVARTPLFNALASGPETT